MPLTRRAAEYLAAATPGEIGYLAGLIDGEGCVSLHGRRDPVRGYCTAALQVSNTDLELLDWLHRSLGGTIYQRRDGRPTRKVCATWGIFATGAREILQAVRPYLRVKAAQADVVLRLDWTNPGRAGMTPERRRERAVALAEIRRLNARGMPRP